jgi:hypothetical protein
MEGRRTGHRWLENMVTVALPCGIVGMSGPLRQCVSTVSGRMEETRVRLLLSLPRRRKVFLPAVRSLL